MSRARIAAALACVLGAACVQGPPSFETVTLGRASELLLDGTTTLVEVAGADQPSASPRSGSLRWDVGDGSAEPPALPEGRVVLLARRASVGYRAAALLAGRRGGVFLFVSDRAEERSRLYALRAGRGDAT
jgi:hypothetical protein